MEWDENSTAFSVIWLMLQQLWDLNDKYLQRGTTLKTIQRFRVNFTANVNLYHRANFSLCLWFTVHYLYKNVSCFKPVLFIRIGHFRVPKTLTFKMRLGAQPFLWKWVLFAWEWKMISISKAEHQPSFWNRGPGELGNGLLFWGGFICLFSLVRNSHLESVIYCLL